MKAYSVVKFLFASILVVSLAACNGGGGGGNGCDIELTIIGTWESVCVDAGSDDYFIMTITFTGDGQQNDTIDFYNDPVCDSATGLVKTNQGSYSLGDSITASGMSACEIDGTINSWTLTQDGALVISGTNVPTQYDIVAVEGDILYSSGINRVDPGPITDPADRPTTLDLDIIYTRQ